MGCVFHREEIRAFRHQGADQNAEVAILVRSRWCVTDVRFIAWLREESRGCVQGALSPSRVFRSQNKRISLVQ